MNYPRETIYNAVYQIGKRITWEYNSKQLSFVYTARRVVNWGEVPSQPAFMQRETLEIPRQTRAAGTSQYLLKVQWWIYAQVAQSDTDGNWPSTMANAILDALDAALQPPTAPLTLASPALYYGMKGEAQTLAAFNTPLGRKMVENVWIDGEVIIKDPIAQDSQMVLIVPVSISTGM